MSLAMQGVVVRVWAKCHRAKTRKSLTCLKVIITLSPAHKVCGLMPKALTVVPCHRLVPCCCSSFTQLFVSRCCSNSSVYSRFSQAVCAERFQSRTITELLFFTYVVGPRHQENTFAPHVESCGLLTSTYSTFLVVHSLSVQETT
jgi:hypothetical protein